MFKNYFKIALRNFLKHRTHAVINILGLAIGMACCILILLHVQDELRFDGFHQKADRIHRVIEVRSAPGREDSHSAYVMGPLAPAMAADFPEVIETVRFFPTSRLTVKRGSNGQIVRDYFLTDSGFFKVFDFGLLQGDPRAALVEPRSVVLTETAAKAYFGEENPVDKMLDIEAEDFPAFGQDQFKVTGVLRDPPHNSHLNFSLLISSATADLFDEWKQDLLSWESRFVLTYVLLEENASPAALQAKLVDFSRKYRGEDAWQSSKLYLQPLEQIHFYSSHISAERNAHEGELTYVYMLAMIAFIIVLIACINYMNLATARALSRAKEVGLRKVVGAFRKQLVLQFLGESLLTSFIALLLALGLVELLLPPFNDLAMKKLELIANTPLLLGLLSIVLSTGLVSGLYPAFYLARFQPVAVLKGARQSGARASHLRQGLVITQFALSIIMIVATLVVSEQLSYIRNKNLGFAKEHLVTIDINHDDVQANFLAMKTELLHNTQVRNVTVSSRVPGDWKNFRRIEVAQEDAAEAETQSAYFNAIDEDFLATYKIDLIAGRNLSRVMGSDTAAFLLNETAAQSLFNESPLGKRLRVPSRNFEGIVVGVVKDFHFHSLHEKINPLVMSLIPASGRHPLHGIDYFTLRLNAENMQETIAFITKVHEQFDPVNPIELGFLESWLEQLYSNDARVGKIFGAAAGLAIFIACVGLFGLALFMVGLRTKEIGIRKVLGASLSGIALLLSKDFTKLVLIGLAAAIPIAWLAMNTWLQNFAYRIEIGWWVFALAGGLALVIALMTVSTQAIKAALANPVEALRYE